MGEGGISKMAQVGSMGDDGKWYRFNSVGRWVLFLIGRKLTDKQKSNFPLVVRRGSLNPNAVNAWPTPTAYKAPSTVREWTGETLGATVPRRYH
jgi:hypothetical protein